MTEFPVTVVDAGPMVRATLLLPGCPPERALAAFTDPATLRQWWGGELTFTPAEGDGGTELTVLHGPHGQGAAEQAARSDHREGWEYFLARLGQLLAPAPVGLTGQRDSAPAGRDRSFAPPISAFWPSR